LGEAGATITASACNPASLAALHAAIDLPDDRWLAQPDALTDPAAAQVVVDAAVVRFGKMESSFER